MSMMQVMRIFGPNLWGWVADRTQKRVMVLRLTAFAAAVLFIGMCLGQSFMQFLLLMIAINAFISAQSPLSEALMLSEMKGDLTHYGKLRLWGSVGFIGMVTLAGYLLDWFGVGLTPWIALALLWTVFAISMRLQEGRHGPVYHDTGSVRLLMRRPEVLAFFLSTFLMIAAHASLYVFYSLYLARHGYSKSVIGWMWSLGVVAEIVFFFYQAPIFRRFGVQKLMLASLLLAVVRFAMIGWFAESLLGLVVAQILHAATFGTHHSASVATLQRWFSGALQARGQALYTSISYGLGGTLGGLVLSVFWDSIGPQSVYFVSAGFALGAAGAAALSYRWQPHLEVRK
jgi:PPP family 3-phenylpropionic acid transporter